MSNSVVELLNVPDLFVCLLERSNYPPSSYNFFVDIIILDFNLSANILFSIIIEKVSQ